MLSSRRLLKILTPWFFLAIPLLFYLVMVAYPILYSIVLSFLKWDGISRVRPFVGLANFRYLFDTSDLLPIALKNNGLWMVFFVPLPILFGFALSLLLRRNTSFNVFLRSVFYLPMILSFTVMSIMWSWVYEPTRGVITQLLKLISITPPSRSLLTQPETAIIGIVIVGIWHWIGFPLVLYLAALKDIPQELFETADIDGATWSQKIIHIIVPLVRHATLISVSIGIVLSVKVFDLVFLMAGGYYKHEVLSTLIWRLAFTRYRVGEASAVSIIQFLIVTLILVPYIWINVAKKEVEF